MRHPNSIDQLEGFDIFGQSLADNDRDVGFGLTLIFPKFDKPAIAPIFSPFGFPQNSSAGLAEWPHHTMENITSIFPLRYRLDLIHGKFGG